VELAVKDLLVLAGKLKYVVSLLVKYTFISSLSFANFSQFLTEFAHSFTFWFHPFTPINNAFDENVSRTLHSALRSFTNSDIEGSRYG
jgi:hypothetical protein